MNYKSNSSLKQKMSSSSQSRKPESKTSRSSKSSKQSIRTTTKTPQPVQEIVELAEPSAYSFVFERNNTLSAAFPLNASDGDLMVIHPVYYTGYTDGLTPEKVKFSEKKGKWLSKDNDATWLKVLYNVNSEENTEGYEMFSHDVNSIVRWDNAYFHCVDDLMDYWSQTHGDWETVDVSDVVEREDRNERDERNGMVQEGTVATL